MGTRLRSAGVEGQVTQGRREEPEEGARMERRKHNHRKSLEASVSRVENPDISAVSVTKIKENLE